MEEEKFIEQFQFYSDDSFQVCSINNSELINEHYKLNRISLKVAYDKFGKEVLMEAIEKGHWINQT